MSSKDENLSKSASKELKDVSEFSFGIVVSEWNEKITESLKEAAVKTLTDNGAKDSNIHIEYVPGAFELPLGARLMLGKTKLDAVICLGCVIKGETDHDKYINSAVAGGIMNLGLTASKPIIFGLLTPNDQAQADDRAGGKYGNKGVEAATTAIRMVHMAKGSKDHKTGIGFN